MKLALTPGAGGGFLSTVAGFRPTQGTEENAMAWTAPMLEEIACGMEINMYGPSEDEDHDLF